MMIRCRLFGHQWELDWYAVVGETLRPQRCCGRCGRDHPDNVARRWVDTATDRLEI
jgi:hypothetical protein